MFLIHCEKEQLGKLFIVVYLMLTKDAAADDLTIRSLRIALDLFCGDIGLPYCLLANLEEDAGQVHPGELLGDQ